MIKSISKSNGYTLFINMKLQYKIKNKYNYWTHIAIRNKPMFFRGWIIKNISFLKGTLHVYRKLEQVETISKDGYIVIDGDFNARIDNKIHHGIVRSNCKCALNRNCRKFIVISDRKTFINIHDRAEVVNQ